MSSPVARSSYTALVELEQVIETFPRYAIAFVKRRWRITPTGLRDCGPEELQGRLPRSGTGAAVPLGSDFWPAKNMGDVVVLGSAFARGRPVAEMSASVRVGAAEKRITVLGRRCIEWRRDGQPYIGPADLFDEMPLTCARAYGGVDLRVPFEQPRTITDLLALVTQHPGAYPRNPFGKGYVVVPTPVDGVELPNLEDPADRLTDERLLVGDPARWRQQPLPWALDWHHIGMHPRSAALRREAETAPDVQLEASLGMSFSFTTLVEGTPITLRGMHRDHDELSFALPRPPTIELTLERSVETVAATLTLVVIRPSEGTVSLTYAGRTRGVPRVFIPGTHRHIPLAVRVDGDAPIHYQAPPTVYDRLMAARARAGGTRV